MGLSRLSEDNIKQFNDRISHLQSYIKRRELIIKAMEHPGSKIILEAHEKVRDIIDKDIHELAKDIETGNAETNREKNLIMNGKLIMIEQVLGDYKNLDEDVAKARTEIDRIKKTLSEFKEHGLVTTNG